MASKRKQINVRVDAYQEGVIPRLCDAIEAQHGLAVSVSDLFRMGLVRLEREFLPSPPPAPPAAPAPASPRKRPKA